MYLMRINILALFTILISTFTLASASQTPAESTEMLANRVAHLNLGFGKFVVGEYLSADAKKLAKSNPVGDTYNGTYKFQDGDVFVVVDDKTDVVLAMYKQNEKANRDQVKSFLGDLMMRFEEPTVMAHSKIIYWAFGPDGLLTENDYRAAKENGEIDILGTVKFSSTNDIRPDAKKVEGEPVEKIVDPDSDVYVIISSDPLIKRFMAR